ncbi:MAG TPA: hypothetical protein VFZ68_00700 [Acidimicrobiales bacterium]
MTEHFIAACAGGDIAELVAILDPDVAGEAYLPDRRPLGRQDGAAAVAADAIGRFGPGTGAVLVPVPLEGRPGVVAVVEGRLRAVLRLGRAHPPHPGGRDAVGPVSRPADPDLRPRSERDSAARLSWRARPR